MFSCVLFCDLAFISCIFVSPFSKKTSSRFLFFSICSAFRASNSLQIFHLIPCKSLWDLTCLVIWCHLQQEKHFATYSSLLLFQLHSMNLVLYKHHIFISALYCDSRTKPIHDKFQRERKRLHLYQALLGNWCQRGRERSHQSLSFREITSERESITSSGGERDLQGERILK